jgi:uncharacterized protein (TIGR00730 family)
MSIEIQRTAGNGKAVAEVEADLSIDDLVEISEVARTPAIKCKDKKLCFSRGNEPIDAAIDQLMELAGDIHHAEIVRELIIAALKAGQEGAEKADLKLMLSTAKEMRFTSKVFRPYRRASKITVFGSARIKPESATYRLARQLGHELAGLGYMVITGGGQGIMRAVNEGAGSDHSFGVGIRLPFENQPNCVVEGSPRSITYKYFFNRKVAFIKETDGVVIFPGGFGTMDETTEILTLLQTGKCNPIPLILLEEPDGRYWSTWIDFIRQELAPRGYIDERDFSLFERVTSVVEAVRIIRGFYRRYHSMRYVGERLVIRMKLPLNPPSISRLKHDFGDLLIPGGEMVLSGPLPEESEEEVVSKLPRLIMDFNRRDFGRLRQLVDAINAI